MQFFKCYERSFSTESKVRARALGVEAVNFRIDFLFGLILGERILKHTDNLSSTLQNPLLTTSEGQQIAQRTCTTLRRIRTTEAFDLFWERVNILQELLGVSAASLPRKRRVPSFLELENPMDIGQLYLKSTAARRYYESIELITSSIQDRFSQPGYRFCKTLRISY